MLYKTIELNRKKCDELCRKGFIWVEIVINLEESGLFCDYLLKSCWKEAIFVDFVI